MLTYEAGTSKSSPLDELFKKPVMESVNLCYELIELLERVRDLDLVTRCAHSPLEDDWYRELLDGLARGRGVGSQGVWCQQASSAQGICDVPFVENRATSGPKVRSLRPRKLIKGGVGCRSECLHWLGIGHVLVLENV